LEALPIPYAAGERLYIDHVQQADTGADLDFLVGATGESCEP
jgi:dihydroxy-acid dehydratase